MAMLAGLMEGLGGEDDVESEESEEVSTALSRRQRRAATRVRETTGVAPPEKVAILNKRVPRVSLPILWWLQARTRAAVLE